jgi:pimeloyl-ACP methyl ester carboxylesterase
LVTLRRGGASSGGGEVVHYLARHGESRVAKAVIISAVPPLMVKTATNPGGLPKEVFDGFQAQLAGCDTASRPTGFCQRVIRSALHSIPGLY